MAKFWSKLWVEVMGRSYGSNHRFGQSEVFVELMICTRNLNPKFNPWILLIASKVITHTRISGNVAICPTCPLRGISAHLYNIDENGQRILPAKEIITLTEDRSVFRCIFMENHKYFFSGTFFNFKKIEQDGKTVQVELKSAGTNQSFDIIANTPHQHVTFTIENRVDPIKDLERTHGQLGAALLVLVLIGM